MSTTPTPRTDALAYRIGDLAARWKAAMITAVEFAEATEVALDDTRTLERELAEKEAQVAVLREALEPFARMHREESGLADDHLVLQRGVASDMTCLFEGNIRVAAKALASTSPITGKSVLHEEELTWTDAIDITLSQPIKQEIL